MKIACQLLISPNMCIENATEPGKTIVLKIPWSIEDIGPSPSAGKFLPHSIIIHPINCLGELYNYFET